MRNTRIKIASLTRSLSYFLVIAILASCQNDNKLFTKVQPSQSQIEFTNTLKETDDFNILDYLYFYNGGGVALGDINNDGLVDVYLSGNQVKNKLYLNQGNLQFKDITEEAGVSGNSDWNTGAIMGDINGDGWLDIYVCAVVGIRGLGGYNELFINNGDNTFTESASEYGLDFESYSSSATLLDYDLDGDLDVFLLNHAIHTQESFGYVGLRNEKSYETGDKLLRNDAGKFKDVSDSSGIFGGVNGYGLGLAVSDFNQDGFPDIYVGNDFHEDDYYYLNQGDGTFKESLKEYFGHTTRFSMGNDVADINHDGLPDIISLDMLPEDEEVIKKSEGDEDFNILRLRTKRYGYHYQFSRNMLQINRRDKGFSEVALLSGVSATDWSWSALFADYDQDGEQDLFISNGIPRRPNDLDFIRFVSNDQIKNKISTTKLVDQQALEMMPSGAVNNYIFRGSEELLFEDKTKEWIPRELMFSTATAIGDLDNDGDLDLVINNVNGMASIYENQTDSKSKYLKVKLDYKPKNTYGIGTKVYSYHNGKLQFKELYTVRGFQASSEPMLHFGYDQADLIDSLRIVWPDRTYQTIRGIKSDQTLTVSYDAEQAIPIVPIANKINPIFSRVEKNLGINFKHREDNYTDFDRQLLIPYQASDRGPATAIGDLNGDGKSDIFFGGSKYISSRVFIQSDSSFVQSNIPAITSDSINEEVTAVIADFNSDNKGDLIVGSGGADFFNQMVPLLNNYYQQSDDGFSKVGLPNQFENTSILKPFDYDQDGDLDLFIGNHSISNDFGRSPNSYLLKNNEGELTNTQPDLFESLGMVTDAIWSDFDGDGTEDLIIVGEWMSPKFFKNKNGNLTASDLSPNKLNGLWQSVHEFDIDDDGVSEYVVGNWGENTKFKASDQYPMRMYYSDFDENGTTETILAIAKNGEYYTLEGLDALSKQLQSLRKKYTSYRDFAGQTINQIFDSKSLEAASKLEVNTLKSGYLKKEGDSFRFFAFPTSLQTAPIMAMVAYDFDSDDKEELLIAGNYFGVKPYHGRLDAFSGALINDANDIKLGEEIGLDLFNKSIRHLNMIFVKSKPYLLITLNNEEAEVYQF